MHATVRSVIESAANAPGEVCILDTEASPEHLTRGTARHADVMLAVVEPYYKSLETGRRMSLLARDLGLEQVMLVANKLRDDSDLAAVHEFAAVNDLEIAGTVPFDQSLPAAERARVAPLDRAPDSPAVRAITELADGLLARTDGSGGTAA